MCELFSLWLKQYTFSTKQNMFLCSLFEMGKAIDDMQVGCLWVGDNLISVSLSGNINYLNLKNPSQPKRVVKVF